jgi:hypothetical protein
MVYLSEMFYPAKLYIEKLSSVGLDHWLNEAEFILKLKLDTSEFFTIQGDTVPFVLLKLHSIFSNGLIYTLVVLGVYK